MKKHRDILCILGITFLYHTMNQMFVPTLPIYIASLGGGEGTVGVLVGMLAAGAVIFKLYFARVAVGKGHLYVLRIGLLTAAAAPLLYIPSLGFGVMGLARLIQSIGLAGFVVGSQSLLADYGTENNRGLLFGVYSAMIGVGMVVGPLLGLYLFEAVGVIYLFGGAALVTWLAVILSWLINEKPQEDAEAVGSYQPFQNVPLLVICASMLAASMVYGAQSSFVTLHARAVGINNPAVFFSVFALLYTISGAVAGHLSDRLGRTVLVVPGFFLMILALLVLAGLKGTVSLVVGAFLSGLGFGTVNAVLLTMVSDYSSKQDLPRDMAFFSNAFDLGFALGAMGLGVVARYSYSAVWLVLTVVVFGGLGVFQLRNPERRPSVMN